MCLAVDASSGQRWEVEGAERLCVRLLRAPGRRSAGSMLSGLLVAPITTTAPRPRSPSMSASSVATTLAWILSWSPFPAPRTGTSPSISSKKMTEGACLSASSKRRRRVRSASPENLPWRGGREGRVSGGAEGWGYDTDRAAERATAGRRDTGKQGEVGREGEEGRAGREEGRAHEAVGAAAGEERHRPLHPRRCAHHGAHGLRLARPCARALRLSAGQEIHRSHATRAGAGAHPAGRTAGPPWARRRRSSRTRPGR